MIESKWDEIWDNLLEKERLKNAINDLDSVDGQPLTKNICKQIYDKYDDLNKRLSYVKSSIEPKLANIKGIHFFCDRIKTCESLLVKVINKRYEHINNRNSKYTNISGDTFQDIITDLIGLKFIINYRGKWKKLHKDILKYFPMLDENLYVDDRPIAHIDGQSFLAEIPVAYHAPKDDITMFKEYGVKTKVHKKGYRSVHYIISYENTYIELQVRTIYDEAWSDCDHNYVYKLGSNANNRALETLSLILCKITNSASDISDSMHEIYYEHAFSPGTDGKWSASEEYMELFARVSEELRSASDELEKFRSCLQASEKGE